MDKKQYKRIDWSRLPIENKQTSSGDTNGSYLDVAIDIDENIPIFSNGPEESVAID